MADTHAVVRIRYDEDSEAYQYKVIHYAKHTAHASIFACEYKGEYRDIIVPCDINEIPYLREKHRSLYVVDSGGKTRQVPYKPWFLIWEEEVYPNSLMKTATLSGVSRSLLVTAEADCLLCAAESLPETTQYIRNLADEVVAFVNAGDVKDSLGFAANTRASIRAFGRTLKKTAQHQNIINASLSFALSVDQLDESFFCITELDILSKGDNRFCEIIRKRILLADVMIADAYRLERKWINTQS